VGVKSGLGWYVSWAQGWAEYGKVSPRSSSWQPSSHSDDFALQTARSSSGLAEGNNQVVMTNVAAASGVRVHEICKSFPVPDAPDTSRLALGGISFSIAAGELVSLVGPSGCGKSTLLRLIAGLDVPDSGELLVGKKKLLGRTRSAVSFFKIRICSHG
jgi:ABC-type glutathione transport system ATPase component